MRVRLTSVASAVLATAWLAAGPAFADDKDKKEGEGETLLKAEGALTAADARDSVRKSSYHKVHPFKMTAGQTYRIDLRSKAFDAYLRLETPAGKEVAEDDDGGEGTNARIIYKAKQTGDYRIIATTLLAGKTGKYRLSVEPARPEDLLLARINEVAESSPDERKAILAELKKNLEEKKDKLSIREVRFAMTAGETLERADPALARAAYDSFEKLFAGAGPQLARFAKLFQLRGQLANPDERKAFVAERLKKLEASKDKITLPEAQEAFQLANLLEAKDALLAREVYRTLARLFAASPNPALSRAVPMLEVSAILASPEPERKTLLAGFIKPYEEKKDKLTKQDAQTLQQLGGMLEQKDQSLAAEVYTRLGKLFAQASDADIVQMAKMLEGAGRRLTLAGHELDIKGTTVDGKQVDLKSYRGKLVLVDFWATWCGPCLAELPNVRELYDAYHERGFEVLAVSTDSDKDKLVKFLDNKKLPWVCIYDRAENKEGALSEYYGIMFIPLPILVDREGRVVSMEARGEELRSLLAEHLGPLNKSDAKEKEKVK